MIAVRRMVEVGPTDCCFTNDDLLNRLSDHFSLLSLRHQWLQSEQLREGHQQSVQPNAGLLLGRQTDGRTDAAAGPVNRVCRKEVSPELGFISARRFWVVIISSV